MPTYHVKKTGNDSTGDGSDGNPWLTITASVVKLSPGDILEVHVGTYAESVTPGGSGGISWVSGSSGSRITVRAYGHTDTTTKGVSAGTDAVVIKPTSGSGIGFNKNDAKYITLNGFVVDGESQSSGTGLSFNNDANNIICRNMEVKNWGDDGIAGSTSNGSATTDRDNLFQYMSIHNNGTLHSGVGKHGIYWRSRGSIFERLDIYENDVSGIQFYNSTSSARYAHNCIIRYCVIHENMTEYHFQQTGINIGPNMSNLKVHNNLIYRVRDAGIDMDNGTNTDGIYIYNNTIVDIGNGITGNGEIGIRITQTSYTNVFIKNNLIYDVQGDAIYDPTNLATKANNFLDTENANFNGYTQGSAWDLTLTGSTPAAILTGGADLGSEYYDDFAGNTRSGTFSMGAYANEVAVPDPPLDPVIIYPTPLSVVKNTNKLLTEIQAQDNNDPDVGNYTLRLVLMGNGTLNDGV